MAGTLEIRPDPPLDSCASLMNSLWPRPTWRYDAALLAAYFGRGAWRIVLGAWLGDELVGCIGGVPLHAIVAGREIEAIYTSFYTVHPKASFHGASPRLMRTLLEQARVRRIVHYVTMIDSSQDVQAHLQLVHSRAGLAIAGHGSLEFWVVPPASLVWPRTPGCSRDYVPADRPAVRVLLQRAAQTHDFVQTTAAAALTSWLAPTAVGRARILDAGCGAEALVLLRPREVLDLAPRRNLHLDCLITVPGLAADRLAAFVAEVIREAGADFDLVVAPTPPGGAQQTLRRLGFVRAPRSMVLYAGNLDGAPALGPFASPVLEVF